MPKFYGKDINGNWSDISGSIEVEKDPTVPSWAKQQQKPTYTASEVGALPDTTKIPGKTSDLTNDSGYITIAVATLLNYYLKTETYAKTETYSQTEVDNLISGLDKRLNAIADSEDVDLDQLSEIVAYIKSNKSLIDSITTSKVNVSDIVDNLTTADSKKPLSAAQGNALKALYDALPAWAKAAEKPTYSKSEVGLGNVDNVRQYSESNPPPYPVRSVNGQTGAVTVTADGIGAASKEQYDQLSDAIDGKQPKGDYALKLEIPTTLPASDVSAWAKQPDKPSYTASEIGALPASTKIPAKMSDLQNDSGFITRLAADLANYYAKSDTYNRSEIDAKISAIPKFAISVVSALPTSGISETTVYLVKSGTDGDLYTEYIYVGGKWEILGSQKVDLTGYATEAWVNQKLGDYLTADTITAEMVTNALGYTPAKSTDVPAVDSTLTKSGQAADAAVVGQKLTEQSKEIADLTNTEDKVEYIVPALTPAYYVNTSGTVVTSTSDMSYTERIAVKEGQTVRAVVQSTSAGGNDMYVTLVQVTAYVNGIVNSSLGLNGVGLQVEEYVVPVGVTEVVLSVRFLKTAYSNPRVEITTPATNSIVSLGFIRNDYTLSLPKKFYLRNGETADIYLRNLTTPNYKVKLGNYTDSTTIRNTDDKCKITGNAVASKSIQYAVYDNHYNEVESGTMALSILGTAPASQKMLCIGDSFISMNEIEPALRNLFTADGKTLTLLGTKGSGANLHEGYAGKKYTDFANGFSGSPFGESGFDFANYMSAQGYSGLNSVYIQLGTNDVSASNPNQNLTGVIDAMRTMINSIKSYDSNIKIYIGLTVMPNLDSEVFAETYNGIGWNWAMKQNMLRLNDSIITECESISNVKVVAMNCVLDAAEDIRDNVHPTTEGFDKMATQLYYTMMS